MRHLHLQLERLRRHYAIVVASNDEIALLDLAHTLRNWTELKAELTARNDQDRSFVTGTPTRSAVRAARDSAFVFVVMPGGVLTKAGKGFADIETPMRPQLGTTCRTSFEIMDTGDGLLCRRLAIIYSELSAEQQKAVKNTSITHLSYSDWLAAEAVRVRIPDAKGQLETVTLSREIMITRVANTLQASHSGAQPKQTKESRYDPVVQFLLDFKVQGLSLPHYVLLKIAQDILDIAPDLLA